MIELHGGTTALVISLPHVGRELAPELAPLMTTAALAVPDTDWHVEQLYGFARAKGAAWLQPRWSRYVVDLNRPPDDTALYAGQLSTGLCPSLSFAGAALYKDAMPSAAEIGLRRERYWSPYHAALRSLLNAAIARHGYAVLLDAHSIRSQVPRLFEGRLPDINVGTNDGASCAAALSVAVMSHLRGQGRFSSILNGRFKGGYITRHYGDPGGGVHAMQIELAQSGYMQESATTYDPALAAPLIGVLRGVIDELLAFRPG